MREKYLQDISAGIKASQAAKDTSAYTSSISAMASWQQYQPSWAKAENYIGRKQESWRSKISIPLTKNGDNYSPLKNNAISFLKAWTINAVLDFWKRIMSGIVSQVQLWWKNTMCYSDQYPIFFVARRKHTLGFSTLQFNFQCHDIAWVEVIQYLHIWGIVCFLLKWTMQRSAAAAAALNFVLSVSANFREPVCAHLQCSFDRSLRNIVETWKLFRRIVDHNLMPLQMIMIETLKSGSIQSGGGQQYTAFKCKSCRGIFDSTASYRQHRINKLAQGTGCVDPSNMAEFTFQSRGDMATGILRDCTHLVRHWNHFYHYS